MFWRPDGTETTSWPTLGMHNLFLSKSHTGKLAFVTSTYEAVNQNYLASETLQHTDYLILQYHSSFM